jgi:hypothetical protein
VQQQTQPLAFLYLQLLGQCLGRGVADGQVAGAWGIGAIRWLDAAVLINPVGHGAAVVACQIEL